MHTAVITFGRFNPITKGHEKVIDTMWEVSESLDDSTSLVFVSHSQKNEKNPLSYNNKLHLMKEMFEEEDELEIVESNLNNIFDILISLDSIYENIVIVWGSDRISELSERIQSYNGKGLYEFDSIEFVSSGDREGDNISASRMRELVSEGDIRSFKELVPSQLEESYLQYFNLISDSIDLLESDDIYEVLSAAQRIKRGAKMKRKKNRLKIAKKRVLKKRASRGRLQKRARRSAISTVKKKLSGGKSTSDMSRAEKARVERKVQRRKGQVNRLARRGLKTARKRDLARRR